MFSELLSMIIGNKEKKSCKNQNNTAPQNNEINKIKFSKKFEEDLFVNQDKLLLEEINRQYNMYLSINQKYNAFLDTVEKEKINAITDLKEISINNKIKPSLTAIINQNNQIDAIFKKVDLAKKTSQKKDYLKAFLTDDMNYFIMDDILKSQKEQNKSEEDEFFQKDKESLLEHV